MTDRYAAGVVNEGGEMLDSRSRPLCSRWLETYCEKCGVKRYMYEGNEVTFDGSRTSHHYRLVKGTCSSCYAEGIYTTDEATRKDMDRYTIMLAV